MAVAEAAWKDALPGTGARFPPCSLVVTQHLVSRAPHAQSPAYAQRAQTAPATRASVRTERIARSRVLTLRAQRIAETTRWLSQQHTVCQLRNTSPPARRFIKMRHPPPVGPAYRQRGHAVEGPKNNSRVDVQRRSSQVPDATRLHRPIGCAVRIQSRFGQISITCLHEPDAKDIAPL